MPDARAYTVAQLTTVRSGLVGVLARQSANDVPSLCERLGLDPGGTNESFMSKAKYVQRRLAGKSGADLLSISRAVLQEYEDYTLAEAVSKLEELGEPAVSELTRRRIVSLFDARAYSTEFRDIDFIQRVFPLKQMSTVFHNSTGTRTLEDDFYQATVRNNDWDNAEIAGVLGLLTCSRRQFFRFLEALTDPICQKPEAQTELVVAINAHLEHDGYRLVCERKLSGSPVYNVRRDLHQNPANDEISTVLKAFDADTVHARWAGAMERQLTDAEGAITLARTLLEDVCKWIIVEAGGQYQEKDDLPVLYRNLANILNIAPDNHTEAVFKQILGGCQSIVESLGALRNKIGDAHSPGPKRVRPAPRHAQLAVNLSGSMASFLVQTWIERQKSPAADVAGQKQGA